MYIYIKMKFKLKWKINLFVSFEKKSFFIYLKSYISNIIKLVFIQRTTLIGTKVGGHYD